LLIQARDALGVELATSVMVGDRMTDIEAGVRAGCALTVLVESGMHTQTRILTEDPPLGIEPDARVGGIQSAVAVVLQHRAAAR
jgi:ribonucleotide monophosphatase NagD (HAD superfamily)